MTERIVDFLSALVATVGDIETSYCLAERRTINDADGKTTEIPYIYQLGGNYTPVEVDGGSVSYWRLGSPISFAEGEGYSVPKPLSATYPLRFFAIVNRDNINPLSYSQDVANILQEENSTDLRTQLGAKKVKVTVNGIDTDTPKLWREEFKVPVEDLHYTRSMIAIDVTVNVVANRSCWENCDNYPDILQGFPWCSETAETVGRLTPEQIVCVEDYLCEVVPCQDATLNVNGVEFDTIPSGDTYPLLVKVDGVETGTFDIPNKTVNITSTPCAAATVQLNGTTVGTIASGATGDFPVTQDGSPVGSWNGSAWIVPTPISPSLSIEVYSDAGYTVPVSSLNYGATAYIKLVASDITPTSYSFFFGNGAKNAPQVTQVGDSLAWVVSLTGTVTISATATDGTDATADATPFVLTVPNTYIGGKCIKTDGVVDRIHGWVNKNRLWDTYGFGFCIIDPTSTGGGLIGMGGFGMVNLSSGAWNSKSAIDISGRPNQTWSYTSVPNAWNHIQVNMAKDVSQFIYVQVTASTVEIYMNGVRKYSTARTSTAPLRSTEISLGYTHGFITPRNAKFWNPLVTNGLLSEAEVLSLSDACLAGTDPTAVATSKILECWDFGRLTLGVPSTDVYNPTTAVGMIEESPLYLTNTFTAPDGIVSL